jgi:hypothetical protein
MTWNFMGGKEKEHILAPETHPAFQELPTGHM